MVRLTLLGVCLGLGLRINGETIQLDEVRVDSECKKIFNNQIVDVNMVYDFLLRHSQELSLEDYCRLYILLGISEFLYPSRTIRVFPILFTIVDDLCSLGKHN